MKTRYVTIKFPLNNEGPTTTDVDIDQIAQAYLTECDRFKLTEYDPNFPINDEEHENNQFDYESFDEPIAINVTEKYLIMTFAFDLKEKEEK